MPYARAKAAGAEILFDIEGKHYGGERLHLQRLGRAHLKRAYIRSAVKLSRNSNDAWHAFKTDQNLFRSRQTIRKPTDRR
jgi:hypothetical protein